MEFVMYGVVLLLALWAWTQRGIPYQFWLSPSALGAYKVGRKHASDWNQGGFRVLDRKWRPPSQEELANEIRLSMGELRKSSRAVDAAFWLGRLDGLFEHWKMKMHNRNKFKE